MQAVYATPSLNAPCCAYFLDFSRFGGHYVDARLDFVAQRDDPILWMPTWIEGSYLIREFAKNVGAVHYQVGDPDDNANDNPPLRAKKIAKNRWQIHAKKGDRVRARYTVYCVDPSVRGAIVDNFRIFVNFGSVLLLDEDGGPCALEMFVPKAFFARNRQADVASGLRFADQDEEAGRFYRLILPSDKPFLATDLLDYPVEIAERQSTRFFACVRDTRVEHRFFVSGVCRTDLPRLGRDLQAICQSYLDWLGFAPFDDYTFITRATQSDYGGLEHINSTALVTPRADLVNDAATPSKAYCRFLGLCSHEYFHSWWVKSVVPDALTRADFTEEMYTPLLWAFEGFTSYIDDLMLLYAGLIDKSAYLELFAEQITRHKNTLGRRRQSVAESSFDAWIKLYRPDAGSQNRNVSYYNTGALVAFGIDALLMRRGLRLFDVVKGFTDKAQTRRFALDDAGIDAALGDLLGQEWTDFRRRYIDGVEELPLEAWLLEAGVAARYSHASDDYGVAIQELPEGLKIQRVVDDSAAMQAGLSAGDVIVAINGLKAQKKDLAALASADQKAQAHVFCDDVLRVFCLQGAKVVFQKTDLRIADAACAERWLARPF